MARYSTHDSYESCEPRSIKAVDSIHITKLRREQEELQNQPMKAVDSIAVTKARREQARREKEDDQIQREVSNFSAKANNMYQQKKEQREKANRALKKVREEWLNKVRRGDVKPENLRAMMQGHLDEEDKLMRSFLRMWTTADFSPIAVLGKGSFGTVHLVRCTSNEQIYALKCMSKAYYKRKNSLAMNERDALLGDGLLDKTDRWCARLMCSFQDASNLFLVMEFMQGGSLATHLSRRGRLSLEETAFYIAELIEAVDVIHVTFGTIHRDLKPDNLMLTKKGHLKLLDFGLSAGPSEQSDAPEIVGTPAYMAPESFKGFSQAKADIWAIGIITYECLTGLLPYDEDDSYENFADQLEHLEDQANHIETVLPPKLDAAHDLQSVLGATAAKFNKARRFIEGVLRAKEEERLSLRRCRKEVTTAREKDSPEVWRLLEEIDEKETEVTEQMQRRAELQELLAAMEEELSSTRKDLKASQQRADQWRRLKDEKERELFAQIRKREDAEREASFLRQSAWLADRTARENVALKKQLQKAEATAASRAAGALPKQIAEMECSPLRCCRGDARPTIKKKLMMKWHPDKQPTAEHVEFATQVIQAMQNQPEWE